MVRQGLLIGQVAAKSGLSRKAIRLYEATGILPLPSRTSAGYRVYGPETLAILGFVRQAKRFGLRIAEIKEIVAIRRGGQLPCSHVRTLIESKVKELDETRRALRALLASWRVRHAPAAVCPHIEAKGGESKWSRSGTRFARPVVRAPRSS